MHQDRPQLVVHTQHVHRVQTNKKLTDARRVALHRGRHRSQADARDIPATELRDLMKGLEESLTYVDYLLRRTSSVKPAEPSSPSRADP